MLERRAELEGIPSLLQDALELIYRVDGTPPVAAFSVSEEFIAALGVDGRRLRETLIVHHDGEATNLALYLSEDVQRGAQSFLEALQSRRVRDLDAFCAALEGVSHFVYFTFAGDARPVSRLELELQAEIDKFVVLRVLGLRGELLVSLFDRFRLAEGLEASCQERYVVANRAARRYAQWADRAFREGRGHAALADARRLYRMPVASKLAHISRAA